MTPCGHVPATRPEQHTLWIDQWGGSAMGQWCCNRGHDPALPCNCTEPSKVRLGAYPVRSIVSVEIDGNVLDESE